MSSFLTLENLKSQECMNTGLVKTTGEVDIRSLEDYRAM